MITIRLLAFGAVIAFIVCSVLFASYTWIYWLNDEEEKFVKEFEKEHNAVVYHIIKSYTNTGTFLTILYVSQYRDEWKEDYNLIDKNMQVCYVKNLSDDLCSDFGYIGLRKQIGGLVRVS